MKKVLFILVLAGLMSIIVPGYGQETFTREVEDFRSLSVVGSIRVELYKSDNPKLEITIKDLPQQNLITDVKGETLGIRLKTGSNKNASVKVKVYYSVLEKITVASTGLIVSPEVITGSNMEFVARSGGKMEIEINLDELKAEVVQGAILVFKGNVKKQQITVNTGATYSAYLLNAEDTYVKAGTGAKAKVTAGRIVEANANAGGFVGYIGDPVSEFIKTTLGGEIVKYKDKESAGIIE